MKSDSECLFLVATALQEVARAVYSDEGGIDQEFAAFQSTLTGILEARESADDLLIVRSRLINRIKELKLRSSTASVFSTETDKAATLTPLKDLLAQELGISQVDVSGLNHMNLPLAAWVEQDESATSYALDPAKLAHQNMKSSLMTRLLREWTPDGNKQLYVLNWAECLSSSTGLPDAFPQGLQIVGLSPLLKEGFLMLLVPVLRRLSAHPFRVFLRRRMKDDASASFLAGPQGFDFLYDLRIRVIPPQSKADDSTIHPSPSRESGSRSNSKDTSTSNNGVSWLSSLLPQSGPIADLLDWANRPAADNSFLEAMEEQVGRSRPRSGSRGTASASSLNTKTAEQKNADRAWSLAVEPRERTSSAGSSAMLQSAASTGATRRVDADLERYGIDVPITETSPFTVAPTTLDRMPIHLIERSNAQGSYVAPTESAPAGRLSLVEAKLKAMRDAKKIAHIPS
jgi:hypothetical protein